MPANINIARPRARRLARGDTHAPGSMSLTQALTDNLLATRCAPAWKKIGTRRRAGVQVALFSIHSRNSQGIGDFADARLVVDWCAAGGMSMLQMLPLNDTGALFCPYDSSSSFALDPMYLSLNELSFAGGGGLDSGAVGKLRELFSGRRGYVDYRIKAAKLELLRGHYHQRRQEQESSGEFRAFLADNDYWINDFALFKVLKDAHGGRAWDEWDVPYRSRDPQALADFRRGNEEQVMFQCWLQWQAFKQLCSCRAHAASKHVLLKGDLPILVSRDSADVWAHPAYFNLDYAAGAPPDLYCSRGQRWGMPTYRWDAIAADGYRYLKEKLRYAGHFYDILRVDHVVGLFRIWSIPYADPEENKGLHGFFDPRDEARWGEQGRAILGTMLDTTGMLLCAEDLGTIPPVCREALREFGIPGNDVQRWVKDWDVRHDFLAPEEFRATSVAMLSTHDTSNWAAWWNDEAGTVDEGLFVRKCSERGIDFAAARERLFDAGRSSRGRLRWLESVDSPETLCVLLGRGRDEVRDFIDLYLNSFGEKQKLWVRFGLAGPMRERCDEEIIRAAFKYTLASRSVFCVESAIDWLYVEGIIEGEPAGYRINVPGDVHERNWSLRLPLPMEELLRHPVTERIKGMIAESGRSG